MKKMFMYFFMALLLVTMSGCAEADKYLVNFDNGIGIDISRVNITEGDLITEPTLTDVEGYTFRGWFSDDSFLDEFDFDTVIDDDLSLKALWSINQYAINFNLNLTSELSQATVHIRNYGSVIEGLEDPIKEDYVFTGWYSDDTYTTLYEFGDTLLENVEIYAGWLINDVDCDIYPNHTDCDESFKIALITDSGLIDDESYNQAAWEAVVAYGDDNNISYKYYKPLEVSDSAYIDSIEIAIESGAEIVILPGWLFESALYEVQSTYPDITFVIVDGVPHDAAWINWNTTSNTLSIYYKEYEAGFLAGYAAVLDGYRSLGFTGGMAVPAVVKYGVGFIAGAYYAADELDVTITFCDDTYHYFGDFGPSNTFKNIALSWYDNGTEIIFSVAGGAGTSVMAAAADSSAMMIGVDIDQSAYSSTVLTSAMKNIEYSVYQSIQDFFDGNFIGGRTVYYGASNNGVLLPLNTSRFTNFTQAQYDAILAKLVDGTVVVPADYDALVTFLGDATGYPSQAEVEDLID